MTSRDVELKKFYVVKVIRMRTDNGRWRAVTIDDMDVPTQLAVLAMVRNGQLAKLPGGEFAEGVKEHRNEYNAQLQRRQLADKFPGEDFRVIVETGIIIP